MLVLVVMYWLKEEEELIVIRPSGVSKTGWACWQQAAPRWHCFVQCRGRDIPRQKLQEILAMMVVGSHQRGRDLQLVMQRLCCTLRFVMQEIWTVHVNLVTWDPVVLLLPNGKTVKLKAIFANSCWVIKNPIIGIVHQVKSTMTINLSFTFTNLETSAPTRGL